VDVDGSAICRTKSAISAHSLKSREKITFSTKKNFEAAVKQNFKNNFL
jgi:hypothetical protein